MSDELIKSDDLTQKQSAFCEAVAFQGMNYSDAYRNAYDASNMLPAVIHKEACLLRKNPKVAERIAEIKEERYRALLDAYGKEQMVTDLIENIRRAKEGGNFSEVRLSIKTLAELSEHDMKDSSNRGITISFVQAMNDFARRAGAESGDGVG